MAEAEAIVARADKERLGVRPPLEIPFILKIATAYRGRADFSGAHGKRVEAKRLRKVADRLDEIYQEDLAG